MSGIIVVEGDGGVQVVDGDYAEGIHVVNDNLGGIQVVDGDYSDGVQVVDHHSSDFSGGVNVVDGDHGGIHIIDSGNEPIQMFTQVGARSGNNEDEGEDKE